MKIAHSIEIESAPEKVFYWLQDPERAKQWMTSVVETEIISTTPNITGTTFREVLEENGRRTEMYGSVTKFIPNKEIAFHLDGDYNSADVTFNLENLGDATRLTQSATIQFKSAFQIMSVFMGRLLKKKIIHQTHREFMNLKKLCEHGEMSNY